jgi:hypothetical protein
VNVCAAQAGNRRAGPDFKWHDSLVDNDRCNRQLIWPRVAKIKINIIPFEYIFFNGKVLHSHRGFKAESASRGEEKRNDSRQEKDWDKKQAKGPQGEALLCRWCN